MVFLVAEVGSNHNGSLNRAKKLIDIAVEAGCHAVKFQLIPPFKPEWINILIEYCGNRIEFMATPFNQNGIDALKGKVKTWKIASPEATDDEFVKAVFAAANGSPVFVSDGMSDNLKLHYKNAIPMCCVMKYPAQAGDYCFPYSCAWGLSDHTEGIDLPIIAVAHGAIAVEKHFTDNKLHRGPDHAFALEPNELKEMVTKINMVEKILSNTKLTILEPKRHLQWP